MTIIKNCNVRERENESLINYTINTHYKLSEKKWTRKNIDYETKRKNRTKHKQKNKSKKIYHSFISFHSHTSYKYYDIWPSIFAIKRLCLSVCLLFHENWMAWCHNTTIRCSLLYRSGLVSIYISIMMILQNQKTSIHSRRSGWAAAAAEKNLSFFFLDKFQPKTSYYRHNHHYHH